MEKKNSRWKKASTTTLFQKIKFYCKGKLHPFYPYSCMHFELTMHSVFQRSEWQLWVLLLVLPWAMGGAEEQKCLQICWAFEKLLHKNTLNFLVKQSLDWNLCWARLVEKHKRISFSCCNLTRLKWHNLYLLCILRSMWLHMNYESRFIPECNQLKELSYKKSLGW